jgi:Acyl-CoA dehydrogenases
MVPNSLGPGELLYEFGTQHQKDRWLPTLASGEDIPAFALTGTHSGSDAAAMKDIGVVEYQQFKGLRRLGIRLKLGEEIYHSWPCVYTSGCCL